MTKNKANLMLLMIAILWGFGTCMMKIATSANLSTGLLNGIRGLIFSFLILVFFRKKIMKMTRKELIIALIAGIINTFGFIIQTIGIANTTPANCGFITVTYIVFIPLFVFIIYKQKIGLNHMISIIIALLGMVILTGVYQEGISLGKGNLFCLISALFFALSIAYLGNTAREVHFSIIAFMFGITLMVGGFFWWLVVENGIIGDINIKAGLVSTLYLGVVTSFLCQSMQIFAQKHTKAVVAGLILMLEGFFALVFSIILGYDTLTPNLVIGGVIMTIAFIISEIDFRRKKKDSVQKELIMTD
ncbi:MAG: DMT family transporter [Bacilli bacterium]|nr:DMT family transporter [Bacilli bacterium]